MADVTISIIIPDAYVARFRAAIDAQDPLLSGDTYITKGKFIIRRFLKFYLHQSEVAAVAMAGDDLVG
jgi:hypothetical protein